MASIGIVGAKEPGKQEPKAGEDVKYKLYFGVFFDGTGNNMIPANVAKARRKKVKIVSGTKENWELNINEDLVNGANEIVTKPLDDVQQKLAEEENNIEIYVGTGRSNVAILHSCYQGIAPKKIGDQSDDYKIQIYNIYVQGAGKEAVNDDKFTQDAKNFLGSGMGNGDTGVVSLVSTAVRMVRVVLDGFSAYLEKSEIHFDVFGFSRGAACARLFSYVAGRGGQEPLGCEEKFSKFLASVFVEDGYMHFLDRFQGLKHEVDFLGIFDTVSSIGLTYDDNAQDFGMFSPDESWVKNTFHICALDEFRSHFALTDIGVYKQNNLEVFIPGCHSDIGGGYQIGEETFYLDYRSTLMTDYRLYTENPHCNNGETKVISESSIEELGWANNKDEKNEEIECNAVLGHLKCHRRKILAGYSNIPLSMMHERANGNSGLNRKIFTVFPKDRFGIPKELCKMGQNFKAKVDKETKGRVWIFPGNSYKSVVYQNLRHKYLHFSSTDELLSKHSSFVHSPNRDGNNTICRIIYHGNKGAEPTPVFMQNYND